MPNPLSVDRVELPFTQWLYRSRTVAPLWLLVRLYVGCVWLSAGIEKLQSPVWVGEQAGTAVRGFLEGALEKTSGPHPDVAAWYAYLIEHVGMPNAALFSYAVTVGEVLVGSLLILGLCTAGAAFAGAFMNMSYLLAGAVSSNPILLVLEIVLMLAWRTAGYLGLDAFVLKKFFNKHQSLW